MAERPVRRPLLHRAKMRTCTLGVEGRKELKKMFKRLTEFNH